LRGLALLADSWSTDPPFKDDSGFGAAVAVYRQNIVQRYGKLAIEQGNPKEFSAWFRQHRAAMEAQPGQLSRYSPNMSGAGADLATGLFSALGF